MSNYYGNGVGLHLDPKNRQYTNVIFQKGKPPIAEEFNLLTDIAEQNRQDILNANVPSGFITDPLNPKKDFHFDKNASNMFWMGRKNGEVIHANVNGWVIPVAGTFRNDIQNAVKLTPPSQTNNNVNFVFLEVWKAQISPQGFINKPAEDQIFKYGNVEYGGVNPTNQILDARYGIETTERVQLQYRIRVENDVSPDNPYGFYNGIYAQGPLSNPVSGISFENMGKELGDPGLWRAGLANDIAPSGQLQPSPPEPLSPLNTVDGFVYAIPIALVFRRTQGVWNIGTNSQYASENRNTLQLNRLQSKVLTVPKLAADISDRDMTIIVDESQGNTTFPATNGKIQIGGEIIRYSIWNGTTITVIERGADQSHPTQHKTDAEICFTTTHPFGLFSDQIVEDDVLDIRHVINLSGLSLDAILKTNFFRLIEGKLKTQWKRTDSLDGSSGLPSLKHFQVENFTKNNNISVLNKRDQPDGIRKIFSDAAALQPNNLLVLHSTDSNTQYTFNASHTKYNSNSNWEKGDNIRLNLSSFKHSLNNSNQVRFVHPLEYEDKRHHPVKAWLGDPSTQPLLEGIDKELLVLGEKPAQVSSTYLEGENSSIDVIAANEIKLSAVDFSDAGPQGYITVADYLVAKEAYIIIQHPVIKGAYRITGLNGTGLILETPDGSSPAFDITTNLPANWYIRLRSCTEEDEDMFVVIINTGNGTKVLAAESILNLTYDILYHPNRGMVRCPEETKEIRLTGITGGASVYARTLTDHTGTRDYPVISLDKFPANRYSSRLSSNQDVREDVENTWAEAYVDTSSKSVLFQPLQKATLFCTRYNNPVGSTSGYASGVLGNNATGLKYKLEGTDFCVFVPREALPQAGRIDVPFVNSTTEVFPYGLNSVFQSMNSGTIMNSKFVVQRTIAIYDGQDTLPNQDYGETRNLSNHGSTGGPVEEAMVCRFYDKGGVQGIELPPHVGVARLFGVYIRDSYYQHRSAFNPGNVTLKANFAGKNLLKADSKSRSFIITENNSYVIPFDVMDVSYLPANLSSSQIILEMSVYAFNDMWQDSVQIHSLEGLTSHQQLDLLVNGPVSVEDEFTVVSTRNPYQGNITGTMTQSYLNNTKVYFGDYDSKEHADRKIDIDNIKTPLDPYNAKVHNPVKLEILTSLPFVTTMGTGRIAGEHKAGAITDVGYLSAKVEGNNRKVKSGALEIARVSNTFSGITERLPTGALAGDYLFIGEPLTSEQKTFWTGATASVEGFSQGKSHAFRNGEVILSDGTSRGDSQGTSYAPTNNMYRTYRGGALANATGDKKGGPVVVAGAEVYKEFPQMKSFESSYNDVLAARIKGNIDDSEMESRVAALKSKYSKMFKIHGGVLFGVAYLVRTTYEEVTDANRVMNFGGELQMLVVTGASLGTDPDLNEATKEVLDLMFQSHPTGFGEGYCAADRFRVEGRPLLKGTGINSEIDFEFIPEGGGGLPPCHC